MVVRLPANGTDKVGVDDFLSHGGTVQDLQALAMQRLFQMAVTDYEPEPAPKLPVFPLDTLPVSVSAYVERLVSNGLSLDFCGTATLPALAGAIGGSVCLELAADWTVLPIVWAVLVGEQGAGKTPVLSCLTGPLRALEDKYWARYSKQQEEYQALSSTERKYQRRPVPRRLLLGDTTLEALAQVLNDNPAGVLWSPDETRALLQSLGQYKTGRNADRPKFLTMWNGERLTVDRVKADGTIVVPRAFVCIAGGLQPKYLSALDVEDGLRDRFLMASCPPEFRPKPTGYESDRAAMDEYGALLDRLAALRRSERRVMLSSQNRRHWREARERIGAIADDSREPEQVRSFARKADQHLVRLALVLSEAWREDERMQRGEDRAGFEVSELHPDALTRAERLVSYFIDQRRGVRFPEVNLAATMLERGLDEAVERLARWLENRPEKSATERDIQRAGLAGARTREDVKRVVGRYGATYEGRVRQETAGGHDRQVLYAPSRRPV